MNDLDIAFKLVDQIIVFWKFYVVGAASIIGWIFSRKLAWSEQKRLGIGVVAALFIIFNFAGLCKVIYSLTDIMSVLGEDGYVISKGVSKPVFEAVLARLNPERLSFNLGAHVMADMVILYFIFIVSKTEPSAS